MHRIVVKVGTSTLTHDTGKLNLSFLTNLVWVLSDLANRGTEVVLVTSGAVSVGAAALNIDRRTFDLHQKQAAAALGQGRLMHTYTSLFAENGYRAAQILLDQGDFTTPKRRNSLESTIRSLLDWGAIPIINENDSVCAEEIESDEDLFGDNDTLSAAVAALVDADLLVLLTDIDGLYTGDPKEDETATLIPLVSAVTPALYATAGGAGSSRGTGGMISKLKAGEVALAAGFPMVIVQGEDPAVLLDVLAGKPVGTRFSIDNRPNLIL